MMGNLDLQVASLEAIVKQLGSAVDLIAWQLRPRRPGGKVAGPSGAAAKLGIPASPLESKIKQLRSR